MTYCSPRRGRAVLAYLLGLGLLAGGVGCGQRGPAFVPDTEPQAAKAKWDPQVGGEAQSFRFRDQQWFLRKVSAFSAWDVTRGNPELTVAIIDSGVDYNHPAFKGRIVKGPDFGDRDDDPMDDKSGHGTHVAGIVAADGDAKGIAPGVKIMALKVFPSKDGNHDFSEGLAKAILYAAERGASIINMSLGSPTMYRCAYNAQVDSAINEAFARGVSVVNAAGNSAFEQVGRQCSAVQRNVNSISVVATNELDRLAEFSNYSNQDHPRVVAAPGLNIFSSVPVQEKCKESGCEPPYDYKDGTSMAAPLVAGMLALVRSAMYEDYVRVLKLLNTRLPSDDQMPLLSFQDFYHRKARAAMGQMEIAIPPAQLAERMLFHFTNLNNHPSYRNPAGLMYDANRHPLFGFGRVDALAAVKGAAQVFSAYLGEGEGATSAKPGTPSLRKKK